MQETRTWRSVATSDWGLCGLGAAFGYLDSAELYTPVVLVPAPVLFSLSATGEGKVPSCTP